MTEDQAGHRHRGAGDTRNSAIAGLVAWGLSDAPHVFTGNLWDWEFQRIFNLYELSKMVETVEGVIVELGVDRGASLLVLAAAESKFHSALAGKRVFGFDTWDGVHRTSPEDERERAPDDGERVGGYRVFGKDGENTYSDVLDAVARWESSRDRQGAPLIELIRGDIADTVPRFARTDLGGGKDSTSAEDIKLAHFDANLYAPTLTGLVHLLPRMAVGGIVAFDNYGDPRCAGERNAVREYFENGRVRFDPGIQKWGAKQPRVYFVVTHELKEFAIARSQELLAQEQSAVQSYRKLPEWARTSTREAEIARLLLWDLHEWQGQRPASGRSLEQVAGEINARRNVNPEHPIARTAEVNSQRYVHQFELGEVTEALVADGVLSRQGGSCELTRIGKRVADAMLDPEALDELTIAM